MELSITCFIWHRQKGCPAGSSMTLQSSENCSSAIDAPNRMFNRFFQIIYGKVQMRHLLLGSRFFRPHGRFIRGVALEHDAGICPLGRSRCAYARPILIIKRYFLLKQICIELCQFIRGFTIHRKRVHFNFQFISHSVILLCRI